MLQAVATFDNSKNNSHNPDPSATVRWGEQTWAEMMVGFFDVAVDPSMDKQKFFVRKSALVRSRNKFFHLERLPHNSAQLFERSNVPGA